MQGAPPPPPWNHKLARHTIYSRQGAAQRTRCSDESTWMKGQKKLIIISLDYFFR